MKLRHDESRPLPGTFGTHCLSLHLFMSYYLMYGTCEKIRPTQAKPLFSAYSISLTPDVVELLQRLSQDASDFFGWSISGSAIIRALIRQVAQQGPPAADALFLEVERELKEDVMGGGKQK